MKTSRGFTALLSSTVIIFIMLTVFGCKKDNSGPQMVSTSVEGVVNNRILQTPLANAKVALVRLKVKSSNFKNYVDTLLIAETLTKADGSYKLNFNGVAAPDSYFVWCPNFDQSSFIKLKAGSKNTANIEAHNQSILALTVTLLNNALPPLLLLPDVRLKKPVLMITPFTFNTTYYWKADPLESYDLQARYNSDAPAGNRYFRIYSVKTGPLADTFYNNLTIDANTFMAY